MTVFLFRRYWQSLKRYAPLFLLTPIPPLLYLALAATVPDYYTIRQSIRISPDAPVSLSGQDSQVVRASEIVEDPGLFLGDWTLVRELNDLLRSSQDLERFDQFRFDLLKALQLRRPVRGRIEVTYRGTRRELGELCVDYFARNLLRRAEMGRLRSTSLSREQLLKAGIRRTATPAQLDGGLVVESQRNFWRSDRLEPTVLVFLISVALVFFVIGLLEALDPSFKSERQVGRHLGVPVLGSLSDLDALLMRLKR